MTANSWGLASTHIIAVEGTRFTDDPADPGGATHYGITLRTLQSIAAKSSDILQLTDFNHNDEIDHDDIVNLTKDAAMVVYKYAFWTPQGYANFSDNIAVKLFDMAVNMGPAQGNKLFQKAINALSITGVSKTNVFDGKLGPQTMTIYNVAMKQFGEDKILMAIRMEQEAFYSDLISRNPSLQKFQQGWTNRCNSC